MRKLSGGYIAGAKRNIRDVNVRIEIGDGKTYYSEDIISIDIQSSITNGGFGIGATPSDRLSLKFYGTEKLQENAKISVFVSFNNGSYEQLGLFYCSECTRSGKIISVTAYDKMYRQDKKYCKFTGAKSIDLEALEFPCTMQDMLDYICAFRSIECEFECQPFSVQAKPMKNETEYYTVREIIGFIASAHGCNAHFNLDNVLVFKEYSEASAEIAVSDILDQEVDDNEAFTVTGVLFNVDSETQIYIDDTEGSEYDEEAEGVISVNNPLASVEIAEYVWNKLGNLSYHGGSIKMRGCGIIECGDIIEVENYKLPENKESYSMCITDIVYSINRSGGFTEVIKSERRKSGKTQATNEKQSDKASPSHLSAVSFDKNRLYYNGETYYLQYGFNKRIMCVTKGEKYALLNSTGYNESCIEAATAVIKGLTEDWDLEFDYYALNELTLKVSNIVSGYSGAVKCDWGDGTVDGESSHTYTSEKRVKVKMKLLGDISGQQHISTGSVSWSMTNNPDFNKGIGASIYIGGKFENVRLSGADWVTHICFGENIKIVKDAGFYPFGCEGRIEIGIPPCIEEFADDSFMYNAIDYIYIPETCKRIGNTAFYFNAASEIEIEEKGEELTIGRYSFASTSDDKGGYNKVDIISLPSRVKLDRLTYTFDGCNAAVLRIGQGVTEIPSYFFSGIDETHNDDCLPVEDRPYFIFLPSSITKIGDLLISSSSRPVYIIYAGSQYSWDQITREANWDGANGSRERVTVVCNGALYSDYENVIRNYVRR